jgi:hypothetical protein
MGCVWRCANGAKQHEVRDQLPWRPLWFSFLSARLLKPLAQRDHEGLVRAFRNHLQR